ncbi:MAG: DUF362 domain-containing protein [Candidatus Hermodarchaeia archaeon]
MKGKNPQNNTVEALKLICAIDSLPRDKPILIKPNYINDRHPSTGITTDVKVIEGVVSYLREHKVQDIVIGEGCGYSDTFRAFKVAGVDTLEEKWGIKLIDLNKDEFIEVSPPDSLALRKVRIAKTALESSIISVPKLKLHGGATVTLGLKNMMGVMTPKGSMHNGYLSQNIADLASIVTPTVTVVDGIIAGEGHETSGNPLRMDLVLAGLDPVAVDSVGATVMGVSPDKVDHLRHAEALGLGTLSLGQIEVVGETIEKVTKKFRRYPIR